jgi:dnd system-associated protein 4
MAVRAPNINRSRVHEGMVQRLCVEHLEGLQKRLFPTIREFLCFAALLGFSEGRKIPLDSEAGVEDVSYQQFERGDAEDLIFAVSVADKGNVDILREGNETECAQIFEEYVNGGMFIVSEWLQAHAELSPDKAIIIGLRESGFLPKEESGKPPDPDSVEF